MPTAYRVDPPDLPVTWLPLDDLTAADTNPKKHDLHEIAASIRRHGYADPGVLDQRTGKLVGGHGRADALRLLRDRGESPADWPCARPNVYVDVDGRWWAPVSTTETSDDGEAEALLVALNSGDRSGWDSHGLAELLDGIRQRDPEIGLIGTGYDSSDVDKLLASIAQDSPELPEGDTDPVFDESTAFRVAVECRDETDQATLVEELEARGYTVHLQMS